MASFGDLGERQTVKMIRELLQKEDSPDGMDDDAALIPIGNEILVISTDNVTFERHRPEGMSPERFGWMSAAVNFSDIASMGARPVGFLSALSVPEDMDVTEIAEIMSGIDQCAEFCGTHVIGGDTKPGHGSVSGTAIGVMEGRTPMRRNGARIGDVIAVTGPLGGPAAGYHSMKESLGLEDAEFCLTTPIPRVNEGIALSASGIVSSCIDLSDGLSTALNTLCESSKKGCIIEWDLLPKHEDTVTVGEMLDIPLESLVMDFGGEYELLFTFDRNDTDALNELDIQFHIIGIITDGNDVVLRRDEKYRKVTDGTY